MYPIGHLQAPKHCKIELWWPTPYISFLLVFHFSLMKWWKEPGKESEGWAQTHLPARASTALCVSDTASSN